MRPTILAMPDDLLHYVAVLILREKRSAAEVKRWLRDNGHSTANREWPRQILLRAYDRGLVKLSLLEHLELARRLSHGSGTPCLVAAVDDRDPCALDVVTELAADQAVCLIRQVHEAGQDVDPPCHEVHLGLPAGLTSRAVAGHLARKLRAQPRLPSLSLHTLTTGFFVNAPDDAPIVSLGQFEDIVPRVRFVVFYSAPVVSRREASELPKRPYARHAFAEARKLDIVVTSLSVAGHEHSLFQHAVQQEEPGRADQALRTLQRKAWAGDILWQPYGQDGRFIETDVQAASVVNFTDLVRLSREPVKHVVCIAGPCPDCREPKHEAVLPLLRCSRARRPFDHLVTTASTARELCERLGW